MRLFFFNGSQSDNDLDVIDGYFTVLLDFGSGVFDGNAVWLEIDVRPGDSNDPNAYTTLSPLQEVTPTPYAMYAETSGGDNDWMVSGNDMYSAVTGNVGIGTTTPEKKLTIQVTRPRLALVENGGDAAMLEFHEQENQCFNRKKRLQQSRTVQPSRNWHFSGEKRK